LIYEVPAINWERLYMNGKLYRGLALGIVMFAVVPLSCNEGHVANGRLNKQAAKPAPTRKGRSALVEVREPAVAGGFYPGTRATLERAVHEYLGEVPREKVKGRIVGLLSPHAGYVYSGKTAAYGYKLLEGKGFKRAVVLAPSHHVGFRGASIPRVDAYRTPLGLVKVDTQTCGELLSEELYSSRTDVHAREHSVEVQLPFLQTVLGDFELVPIVLGQISGDDCEKIARPLKKLLDGETVFVVSTDFTHYGYRFGYLPFMDNVKENIRKLDFGAIERIEKMDAQGFLSYQKETGATICGRYPICVLLEALPSNVRGKLLHYETSGEMTGDFSNSVSYVSMVFTVLEEKEMGKEEENGYLNEKEKRTLLRLARRTIENLMEGKELPGLAGEEITPRLAEKSGVFVTLHKKGMLRGCIGYIEPIKPLWEAVRDNAVSAAVRDYRFPPLRKGELGDLDIELSVLTPKRRIGSLDEFEIGKHGIILEKSGRSAVFLPQVAPEQGWDVDETLEHLSMKAGLAPDAWKEGATFYVFEAVVFHE
jgi:AmmeMemoRadiSam system protein B/AmmeMemoRadiSam system protein A